jgi:hypothetical protein
MKPGHSTLQIEHYGDGQEIIVLAGTVSSDILIFSITPGMKMRDDGRLPAKLLWYASIVRGVESAVPGIKTSPWRRLPRHSPGLPALRGD